MKTIFAIINASKPELLGLAVQKTYPTDYLELQPGQWLIADDVTSQAVVDKIGLNLTLSPSRPVGSALVLAISGYQGLQAPGVWEWLKVKWERAQSG
jgi:hypothetical protein